VRPGLKAKKIHDRAGRDITHWVREGKPVLARLRRQDVAVGGAPVSQFYKKAEGWLTVSSPRTEAGIKEGLTAIDSVHGISGLPHIPVLVRHLSHNGYYDPNFGWSKIVIGARASQPGITVIHEIGHSIDDHVFGKKDGKQYGSMTSPKLDSLMTALGKTAALRELIRKAERGGPDRNLCHYFLDEREVFARAYTQWIVARSGSASLREELVERRTSWRAYGWPAQWEDRDFEPVVREFDRLFSNHGWLRRR
jgi:hypothetical protein